MFVTITWTNVYLNHLGRCLRQSHDVLNVFLRISILFGDTGCGLFMFETVEISQTAYCAVAGVTVGAVFTSLVSVITTFDFSLF